MAIPQAAFAAAIEVLGRVLAARARSKKKAARGDAVDAGNSWEAMILQHAGPGRSDPLVPPRTVKL